MRPRDEMKRFRELRTSDEIHLTDGQVWSCVSKRIADVDLGVYLIRATQAEVMANGYGKVDQLYAEDFRALFADAVRGGAKVIRYGDPEHSRQPKKRQAATEKRKES